MLNSVNGTETHDNITATDTDDEITTFAGNDTIFALAGNDFVDAGAGNDVIDGGDGDDTILAGAGFDIADGGEGSDTFLVGLENLGFVDTYTDTGTSGTDSIVAIESNTVIGLINGFGPDNGIEVISGQQFENVTIGGTEGSETWDFSAVTFENIASINAGGGHDVVTGNDQGNTIDAGAGNDIVFGGAGRDFITAGAGFDILDGGEGADIYYVGTEDNGFVDIFDDTGTTGTDRIFATESNTVIGLANGFSLETSGIEVINGIRENENVTIGGTDGSEIWDFTGIRIRNIDAINAGGGNDVVTGSEHRDTINAGDGHDVVNGGNGNDRLFGDSGNDVLNGGNGNDRLEGGAGFDILDGGQGNDTYLFGTAGNGFVDVIQDSGTSARDRILATESDTVIGLASGFSQATSGIEVINGGRLNDNVTIGGTGDNEIWDFSGIRISNIDLINAGGGNDIVTGTERRDTIDGGTGNDVLNGNLGNDRLFGGEGNDILNGGEGRDRLDGGAGFDILDGGEGGDIYYFGTDGNGFVNTIRDSGTEGRDRAFATEDNTIIGLLDGFSAESTGLEVINGRGFENVTIGGTGNAEVWDFSGISVRNIDAINAGGGDDIVTGSNRADTINGQDGNDTLSGGDGDDTLSGGDGNDLFVFDSDDDDDVVTDFTLGEDTLLIDGVTVDNLFTDVEVNQEENGVLLTYQNTTVLLLGLTLADIGSEDVFASVFGFTLPEEEAAPEETEVASIVETAEEAPVQEQVEPVDPDQTLSGSNGNDAVTGGSGNDTINVGNGNDTANGGDGNDILLGDNGNDILNGNNGDDGLDGGNGNDTLDGGAGNDTLVGSNGRDILLGGDGNDTLDSGTGDDTLSGGDGDDVLDGADNDDTVDGGNGNDTLIGGTGNDILDGGVGNDTLTGGFNNDTLTGGDGADTFIFSTGGGRDTVTDFNAEEDTLVFEGFTRDQLESGARVSQTSDGVSLSFQGTTIELEGISIDDFSFDFFAFA